VKSIWPKRGADAYFIRQTLQHALQRLMEMDIEALYQAAYGERSEERTNSRNGYRDRAYETRAGKAWSRGARPRKR
jgi:putative transposase